MKQRIIILLTAAAIAATGCSKSDIPSSPDSYEPSTTPISFQTEDNWGGDEVTKSAVITDKFTKDAAITVYGYYLKGSASAPAKWSNEALPNFMYNQEVIYDGSSWSYSPTKYWPNNTYDNVSFISVFPYGTIEHNSDEATGEQSFKYVSSPFAEYNDDLMMGSVLNTTKKDGVVKFDMKHLLTRLNIEVAAINALEVDADGQTKYPDGSVTGEYDVKYIVNEVTFNDILLNGEVSVDEEDGTFSWSEDKNSNLYITATQGNTLIAEDDINAILKTTSRANTDAEKYTYNSVCKQNEDGETTHAIFVLPQEIENNSYGTSPTVQIRIRKIYNYYSTLDNGSSIGTRKNTAGETEYKYEGEVIYAPKAVALPTPSNKGWNMGDNITMRFLFDLSADNPTPLTVLSMIYNYSDVDIDINVNRNIYIYSDRNDIIRLNSSDTEATMNFYTNYSMDLTVKSTSFDFSIKKSTRSKENCYIGTDDTGVNYNGGDAVYLLKLKIENSDLQRCNEDGTPNVNGEYGTMSGDIATEMLGDAGGMITKLFPITIIKKMN